MRWSKGFRNAGFRNAFIYALFFVPFMILGLLIHELGHSIVVIASGGRVLDFGLRLSGGFMVFDNVDLSLYWLIGLAGGVAWAIYYGFLASKITRLLYIPAVFSLVYAVFEMFYAVNNVSIMYSNMSSMGVLVLWSTFIALMINVCIEFFKMFYE